MRNRFWPIGVCSWSLLVKNTAELESRVEKVAVDVVQIACGDPHHAAWEEGDQLPSRVRASSLHFASAMLGFPGEDYTTPQSIAATGGFGDPATRGERLDRLRWGLQRTRDFGLATLTLHGGFLPAKGHSERAGFLQTLRAAADLAEQAGVTLALETGQETALALREALEELHHPRLRVNFDPANMLLYDMGDPHEAIRILAPYLESVHVKDALRPPRPGVWGTEMPLGEGEVNIEKFLLGLAAIGFRGPLVIERSVEDAEIAVRDIAAGARLLEAIIDRMPALGSRA